MNRDFNDRAGAGAAQKPHHQPHPTLSEQQQRRKSFRNPFLTARPPPLGSDGKRAHVQGQEQLRVRDYTGEANRADEPGTGYRLLRALDELRKREKIKKQRREEGEMRDMGQGRKKGKEAEETKWLRGAYTP